MAQKEFVTKGDCDKITHEVNNKIEQVLEALVGHDLRGGLVKDVSEIKLTLKRNGCQVVTV